MINRTYSKYIAIQSQLIESEKKLETLLNIKGLSKSFSERAKILKSRSINWLILALLLIGFLIYIYYLVSTNFIDSIDVFFANNSLDTTKNFDANPTFSFIKIQLLKFIFHIPTFMLSFWLIWFIIKKHFLYIFLENDYNFKNDLSSAFYTYKNEIDALYSKDDPQRQEELAHFYKLFLNDICKNPTDKHNCDKNTPYSELLAELTKITNNLKKQ